MKIEEFINNLEILPQRIQEHCQQALTEILQQMVAYAKAYHPYTDRSGNLTASIKGEVGPSDSGKLEASFKAEAQYAEAVEYGTHRGSPPLPFMRPTVEMFKPKLEESLHRAMQQAIEEALL